MIVVVIMIVMTVRMPGPVRVAVRMSVGVKVIGHLGVRVDESR